MPAKLQAHAMSDIGMVRSENQDSCALFHCQSGSLVAIVADGMGGHSGGSIASQLAVESIHEYLRALPLVDDASLIESIQLANDRIYERACHEPELRGMGTTIVAMLFHVDGRAWVAHVGDSRAYRARAGELEPLTRDHSLVAELVRRGMMTEEEAETDPRRNEILRSVGVGSKVEIDIAQVEPRPGDRYVLCSDGLTGPVPEDEIAAVLAHLEPQEAAQRLIHRANNNGGADNISVIAIEYVDSGAITDTLGLPPGTHEERAASTTTQWPSDRRRRLRRVGLAAAVVALALVLSILGLVVSTSPGAHDPPPVSGGPLYEGP